MIPLKPIFLLALFATPTLAQHSHTNHGPAVVTESGQSQFAAITEIVEVLMNDPSTDWASVDVQALRDHLVDMDNVTTRSVVSVAENNTNVVFTVTGQPEVAQSIQAMVTAHSPMLASETGWKVSTSNIANGAVLTVFPSRPEQRRQVLGLGFYGLLTIGAHHQLHHLVIAKGMSPH